MSLAETIEPPAPRFEDAGAFLAWAERQPERWELWDGVAVRVTMLTGGSLNHSRLSRNVLLALTSRLGAGPCEAFGPDAAVVLGPARVAFPDASVSCGPEDGTALLHPVVIVEVLSPSTASYDLGDKATAYRRLPSLRHLVLVRQDRIGVQHFHRDAPDREFALTEIDRVDASVALVAAGVEVAVAELYAQVGFGG